MACYEMSDAPLWQQEGRSGGEEESQEAQEEVQEERVAVQGGRRGER